MKSVASLSPAQWYGWPSPRELIDPFLKECTLLNVSDATVSDAPSPRLPTWFILQIDESHLGAWFPKWSRSSRRNFLR
jgi:hypothetical protein